MVETELKDLTDNLKTAIQAQIKVRIIFFLSNSHHCISAFITVLNVSISYRKL